MTKSICECVEKFDKTNKTKEEITTHFGLCAFKGANPFLKEIKRDFNIDLIKDISNSEKMKDFGVQIGMLMLEECPSYVIGMGEKDKNEVEDDDDASSNSLINGTIKKIEKENFIVFHLTADNNVLTKFYWISTIESDLDLPKEYQTLVGKKVNISYYSTEIFDAKIGDYKNLNIISSLKTD